LYYIIELRAEIKVKMEKGTRNLKNLKFYVHTFGCQMNKNDSERIAGILSTAGGKISKSPEESDIIIINTCAVREKSEEKLYRVRSSTLRIRAVREKTFY
jgi:tRNA-2-methylthio-N6-dimethylallyladenosine synthase